MAEAKIKKWGNSLALIIPKEMARLEDLDEGDIVKLELSKEKRVDGFGMFKNAPPFSRKDKGDSDF